MGKSQQSALADVKPALDPLPGDVIQAARRYIRAHYTCARCSNPADGLLGRDWLCYACMAEEAQRLAEIGHRQAEAGHRQWKRQQRGDR